MTDNTQATPPPGDLATTIFTGAQVAAICDAILADEDNGFVNVVQAAREAAQDRRFEPLRAYFSTQASWTDEQEETLFVLATSFRRFAENLPDDAKEIVKKIRANCDESRSDYVHW